MLRNLVFPRPSQLQPSFHHQQFKSPAIASFLLLFTIFQKVFQGNMHKETADKGTVGLDGVFLSQSRCIAWLGHHVRRVILRDEHMLEWYYSQWGMVTTREGVVSWRDKCILSFLVTHFCSYFWTVMCEGTMVGTFNSVVFSFSVLQHCIQLHYCTTSLQHSCQSLIWTLSHLVLSDYRV